jgi:hypothetical protein
VIDPMQNTGKTILIIGIIIAIVGLIIWLFGDKLNWFGNFSGDIKVKRKIFLFICPLQRCCLSVLQLRLSFG